VYYGDAYARSLGLEPFDDVVSGPEKKKKKKKSPRTSTDKGKNVILRSD
jgi:hypothetical protein